MASCMTRKCVLKGGLLIVLLLIAGVLGVAATKPDDFRIQRTANINATPDEIFAQINDLHKMEAWSPWEKLDPAMKRAYSGEASGKGAAYEWEGNMEVGKGRMEIIESTAPSKVMMKLDFMKPFEAHNITEFTMEAKGDTTDVTWAMYGPSPYISKVMSLVFDCDTIVGTQFETGLANLKAMVEK